MQEIEQYLTDHRERNENELFELLRMASVSTDSQYADEVAKAGGWVAGQFQSMGFTTEVVQTKGHPIVYAETPVVAGAPVVLVYVITMFSLQIHSTSGFHHLLNPWFVTAMSWRVAPPTTRVKC